MPSEIISTEKPAKLSPKAKKRLITAAKCAVVLLTVLIVGSVSLYFNVLRKNPVIKSISSDVPIMFPVLLYGDEKLNPGELGIFFVIYEKRSNVFKVLSVNPDMVVFRKKAKALSFKHSFNETLKKDRSLAAMNLYTDLFEIIHNNFPLDFSISASYSSFLKFAGGNRKLKELLLKKDFAGRDEELLNEIEIVEAFVKLIRRRFIFYAVFAGKKLNTVDTNISKIGYIKMLWANIIHRPRIMFCDLPAKYTKTRIEPDRQNIVDFLGSVYYPDTMPEMQNEKITAEVKNASGNPRMAKKASEVLRDNGFDVMDWSTSRLTYDKTLIKDYKGNYAEALKAARVLKSGKILILYNSQSYFDMGVFIGKDCKIYDKLDKTKTQGESNGKD